MRPSGFISYCEALPFTEEKNWLEATASSWDSWTTSNNLRSSVSCAFARANIFAARLVKKSAKAGAEIGAAPCCCILRICSKRSRPTFSSSKSSMVLACISSIAIPRSRGLRTDSRTSILALEKSMPRLSSICLTSSMDHSTSVIVLTSQDSVFLRCTQC
ncbi:hypothetical protein D3C84_609620 [compost metagenome]